MGSWGRAEVTSGSDDDFLIVSDNASSELAKPSAQDVANIFDSPPGSQGVFGTHVSANDLVDNIGLDADANTNLTRRLLLLLESVPATNKELHARVRSRILARYLGDEIKSWRPPRFLLNDVVRYWRTICVDFPAKVQDGPSKWGMRNAKLRTSRKMLFASGLLPVLDCHRLDSRDVEKFLSDQFVSRPVDRVAWSFLTHSKPDAGARVLGAYDEFLGLLDSPGARSDLASLPQHEADASPIFDEVRRIGSDIQAGLTRSCSNPRRYPRSYVTTQSSSGGFEPAPRWGSTVVAMSRPRVSGGDDTAGAGVMQLAHGRT